MVKSNEGTKLLHMMRPAIQVIPEIETPVATVSLFLFRSPNKQSKSGQPLLSLFTYFVARFHSTESSRVMSLIPSTG